MKYSKSAINRLINKLNENKNVAHIVSDNLNHEQLTEEEKIFIKTYRPEKALIIYGTLAPGRPNHHIVEHIEGEWKKAVIRGQLENIGWGAAMGYKGFRHSSEAEGEVIEAIILISDELVANWQMLDEFEGEGYKRILAPYELEIGETGVGYIYAINEE